MKRPYCDLKFLISLWVDTRRTELAHSLLSQFDAPIGLNAFVRLQLENGFRRQHSKAIRIGKIRYRAYLADLRFLPVAVDWDAVFSLALKWNAELGIIPPPSGVLLHPAIAVVEHCTHFLSFDLAPRIVAEIAGLSLLPEKI